MYIKYIRFGLVGFYGISTLIGNLKPTPLSTYVYIKYIGFRLVGFYGVILADLKNAVVWMVSIYLLIFISSSTFTKHFMTLPSALVIIGITVIFNFSNYFNSLARSKHLSLFSFSLVFTLWSAGTIKSTIWQFLLLLLLLLLLLAWNTWNYLTMKILFSGIQVSTIKTTLSSHLIRYIYQNNLKISWNWIHLFIEISIDINYSLQTTSESPASLNDGLLV